MTPRVVSRIVAIALLLAVLAPALFGGRLQGKMRDFEVYWTAGGRAATAAPLYRPEDGHYRFKYLPGFAVIVTPLAELSLARAKSVWLVLSVVCLVLFVTLSAALVPERAWRPGIVAALTVVALAKFFGHELVLGQVNLLFGLVCAVGLAALVRKRELFAGLCLGLAVVIKPYAVGFAVYLLIIRRWRAAAAAIVGIILALFLSVPAYGIAGTAGLLADWWRTASETSAPLLTNADATSIVAMYAKWLGWGPVAAALSGLTLGALGVAFVFLLRRRGAIGMPEVLEVALLLTLIPLATPQGWDYALLLSAPLVALLIDRTRTMPSVDRWATGLALALVAFSLYDVMGRAAYRVFMAASAITVCYLAIIAVAIRLRLRGVA